MPASTAPLTLKQLEPVQTSNNYILQIVLTVLSATKVWHFYVSATSATNVAPKMGLTRFLDDLGIMHLGEES